MTSITNNISSDALSSFSESQPSKTGAAEAQDRFLKLLVTQMQNQDPLNPMDNAQVTSQMAQLSTVTGIDKLNSSVNSLLSSFQSNQSLQAASVIGKGILAEGNNLKLQNGDAAFGIDLAASADDVTVAVKNSSGNTIATLQLGAQDIGVHSFSWDGVDSNGNQVADGKYTFEVSAKSAGSDVASTGLSYGVVNSVSTNAQGVKVNTDFESNIDFGTIRQII